MTGTANSKLYEAPKNRKEVKILRGYGTTLTMKTLGRSVLPTPMKRQHRRRRRRRPTDRPTSSIQSSRIRTEKRPTIANSEVNAMVMIEPEVITTVVWKWCSKERRCTLRAKMKFEGNKVLCSKKWLAQAQQTASRMKRDPKHRKVKRLRGYRYNWWI